MIRVARASLFLTVLLSAATADLPTTAAAATAAAPASPAAAALHSLMQTEWLREMREDPLEASADGFHQYDGLCPDVRLSTLAREHQEDIQALRDLAAIGRNLLTGEDRISYDLLEYRYRMRVQDYGLEDQLMPVNELAAAKRVDPLLVDEFPIWILPRVPYGVRPIPASLAPDTYPAYSDPPAGDGSVAGYMSVNLYKPESRPKYEIQVLTCHEGRPGHQLQIPIAMELKNLPDFRRFDYYSSYGEGWALYTETLCDEMGLYDDPYSRFGYLDYQMWRAVRLVVDTGIHSEGWTRAQAVRYFEDNSALSEQNINTEVDRYIAWPGQALSYMIGELELEHDPGLQVVWRLPHEHESRYRSTSGSHAGRHRAGICRGHAARHRGRNSPRCAVEGQDLRARAIQVPASGLGLATLRA